MAARCGKRDGRDVVAKAIDGEGESVRVCGCGRLLGRVESSRVKDEGSRSPEVNDARCVGLNQRKKKATKQQTVCRMVALGSRGEG